jgi:hypothetical protein
VVALAARKVLCINEAVRAAGPAGLINERCADLIQVVLVKMIKYV